MLFNKEYKKGGTLIICIAKLPKTNFFILDVYKAKVRNFGNQMLIEIRNKFCITLKLLL